MKFFVDTAEVDQIKELNDLGMTTVEKLRFRRSFKSS